MCGCGQVKMDSRIPEYLIRALTEAYGEETAGKIEEGFRAQRPTTLRVNRLVTDKAQAAGELLSAGLPSQPVSWYEDALVLPGAREAEVQALPLYTEGRIYLQSLSAMLPVLYLEPQAGEAVLDMAAAPGGKTTQIAAQTMGKAQITACERDKTRAERLRYNLARQHVQSCTVLEKDARQLDDFFRFDRILLDAPCTGSGTLDLTEGAKPRRMEAGWVQKTVKTQKALMDKAVRVLKKGGTLIYSTCSILPVENEEVVAYAKTRGMELIPIQTPTELPLLPVRIAGTLCVCPSRLYEGFFVARLRKL